MAKSLKTILEVAEPKPGDEKRFKDKHVIQKTKHPAYKDDSEEDAVFTGSNVKKDKTKKAGDHSEGEDAAMYEETLYEGVVDTLKNIVKTRKEQEVKFKNGSTMDVDPRTAKMVLDVHSQLGGANARKFKESLEKGESHFMKMVDFAGSVS